MKLVSPKNTDLCSLQSTIEAQKKHLYNVNHAKPLIDNKLPWMPYRTFSFQNKNSNVRNMEIYSNNKILLHKMEKIDGKTGSLNPMNLVKSNESLNKYHQFGVILKRINYHKKIENENMNFLKRLHSAKTMYGKRKFTQDFYQNEVYKRNYSKTNKNVDLDYSSLARLQTAQSQRKGFMKYTNFTPNKNLRPITAPKLK